jgi:hypothetical protein
MAHKGPPAHVVQAMAMPAGQLINGVENAGQVEGEKESANVTGV